MPSPADSRFYNASTAMDYTQRPQPCSPVSSLVSCCLVMVLRAGLALGSVRERPDTSRTRDALPMSAQEIPPPIALYRMITGFSGFRRIVDVGGGNGAL